MAAPGQTGHYPTIRKRRRRRRRRRVPLFPFVLLAMLVGGIFMAVRFVARLHPRVNRVSMVSGYVSDPAALRSEYSHYYGKAIEESRIENQFRQAAGLAANRNNPGAAAVLETLSRTAAVPVVFHDLGVLYASLGDNARAADAFREVLARDQNYAPARQFLHDSTAIPQNAAEPYNRESEPNNQASTANLIALGIPVSGEVLAARSDIDYFRLIAPAAPRDLITIELANYSIGFAPRLHIYDSNLRLLSWGEKGAHAGESIRVVGGPPPNTAIYIAVSADDANGGQYVLSAKPQKAFDAYEPNDDIMSSHRITMGEEIHANIMDAEDTDYYSFQSPRKGTVTVEIRNGSDTLIPAITTYNNDRRNLGFGPELRKPGLGLHQTIDVEKDLIYYIQVWSQGGTAGAYTLRVD